MTRPSPGSADPRGTHPHPIDSLEPPSSRSSPRRSSSGCGFACGNGSCCSWSRPSSRSASIRWSRGSIGTGSGAPTPRRWSCLRSPPCCSRSRYFAGGELIAQAQLLGGRVADVQKELTERIPPFLLELLPKGDAGSGAARRLCHAFGRTLASGLLSIGIAFILTVYLLLDGRRTYEWLVAFAPHEHRARVRQHRRRGPQGGRRLRPRQRR